MSRSRLGWATFAAALGFSALAAGAVHLPLLITYALVLVASGLAIAYTTPAPNPTTAQVPRSNGARGVSVALALAVFCLLQALPIPFTWLEALAPANADIWLRSRQPLGLTAPSLASLSLAPGRSLLEALKMASYALAFGVSAALSRRHGVRSILQLVFSIALVVAAVTAAHQLVGAERLYGFYRPIDAYSIAPLLNANSRAGFLNLGLFCGLGLLFRAGAKPHAALIGLGVAFIAAQVLLCQSVGGTATLALGILLVVVLPRGKRVRGTAELSRWVQAGVLVSIGLGALLLALAAQPSGHLGLEDRSLEKLDLFARAAQMACDFLGLGIGRGAFGSVFAAYQGPGPHVISEHAENFPLQWATEWGVPVTVLALVAFAWALSPAIFSKRNSACPLRRPALVGCGVLLLQNLVDLGLEIPAVSALLATVLGGLCGAVRLSADTDTSSQQSRADRAALWAGCALTTLSLGLSVSFGVESSGRLRHELHSQLLAASGRPTPEFWSALQKAIGAYPAEPYFFLLGSSAALAADRNAIAWVARAIERSPENAQAYLQLGQILHARGSTSQAVGALRRAVELNPVLARPALRLATDWKLSGEALEAVVPQGITGIPMLLLLAGQSTSGPERLRILERALERDPSRVDTHYRLAFELWRDLARKGAALACANQRDHCFERAIQHVRKASVADNARAGILEAQLLREKGLSVDAEAHLAETCARFPSSLECGRALVDQALANASSRLESAVNALVATACGTREVCGETHLQLGNQFARSGQWDLALGHFRQAAKETPSPEAWQAVARGAEHMGQVGLAGEARRRGSLLQAGLAQQPGARPPVTTDDSVTQLPAPDEPLLAEPETEQAAPGASD